MTRLVRYGVQIHGDFDTLADVYLVNIASNLVHSIWGSEGEIERDNGRVVCDAETNMFLRFWHLMNGWTSQKI